MSKLYDKYLNLKKDNSEIIYLFKSGIFYISLQDDAKFLSKRFGFKLTNFTDEVQKCGFPANSIEKYSNLFKNNNINFKIIDSKNNISYSPSEYKQNTKIEELLQYINDIDPDSLSIAEAYTFIEKIKTVTEKILNS